jgi:hypothetical protein
MQTLFQRSNPVLDPYFDEMGGDLVLAQIIDPVHSPATKSAPGSGDPEGLKALNRYRLQHQHRRLQRLAKRLRAAQNLQLSRTKDRIQRSARRLPVAHLASYPKFRFPKNHKCNPCVPYNGHHTPYYWGTGQADCW